MVHRWKKLK